MSLNCKICNCPLNHKQKKYCSVTCKSKAQVKEKTNIKSTINTERYKCIIDDKTFSINSLKSGALKKHSLYTLNIPYDINDYEIINIELKDNYWSCPYCSHKIVNNTNNDASGFIRKHIEIHTTIENYVVEFPKEISLWKMYFRRKKLEEEMLVVDNQIECKICNKTFKKLSNSHLQKHNITPTEYKLQYNSTTTSPNQKKIHQEKYFQNENLMSHNYTSKGQNEIKEYIQNLGFTVTTRRKDNVELDIFIPELNVAIEYNGLYWHSQLHGKKTPDYHVNKTNYCENNNIHLIHIFEDEWKLYSSIIKSRIKNILCKNDIKIFARKCTVQVIDAKTKNTFLRNNHIQQDDKSKISLGLFYNDLLVSVMTFRTPLISMGHKNVNKNTIELSRFCSLTDYNIIGGANKLFSYFLKNYNYTDVFSYADRKWTCINKNSVYEQLGFKLQHITKPNYFYLLRHSKRYSRFNYTKSKIIKMFPNADINLSEWENMIKLGFDRIWDCGSLKYVYTKS